MNKFTFRLMALMMAAVTCLGFAACGSDDDEDTALDTPQYEAFSAKYNITDSGSDVQSIELTASGNYIVVKNPYRARTRSHHALKGGFIPFADKALTRSDYGYVVEGKFTRVSDTEYNLEGWGRLTISGSSDNALSLSVTYTNGTTQTWAAQKAAQTSNSSLTSKLCRTWRIASFKYTIRIFGKTILDKEYKMTTSDLNKLRSDLMALAKKYADEDDWDADDEDDWEEFSLDEAPNRVIFTKAGTYMVEYNNNTLAVSTWKWRDESKGTLYYSWDYDSYYDDEWVTVGFRNNQLALTEEFDDEDEGDDYGVVLTWYMDEVK